MSGGGNHIATHTVYKYRVSDGHVHEYEEGKRVVNERLMEAS